MRTSPLECIIYFEYIVYARPGSFQIQNGGCVIGIYSKLGLCIALVHVRKIEFNIFQTNQTNEGFTRIISSGFTFVLFFPFAK